MKIYRDTPNLFKYVGNFTRRLKYLLFFPHTLNRHKNNLFDLNGIRLFVRPSACINRTPTGQIYVKFDIRSLYENMARNTKFG